MKALEHKSRGRRAKRRPLSRRSDPAIQVVIMSIQDRAVDKSFGYLDNIKYDHPYNYFERSGNDEKMCALRRGDG